MNEELSSRLAGISPNANGSSIEWRIDDKLIDYQTAVTAMETRADAIFQGTAPQLVWLVQHPSLYTAGTSAKAEDLLKPQFPVFQTGRGGEYTYHGPGQRVAYVMLDLKKRGQDIRRYICDLEEWLIRALARFNVKAERRSGRIGLWVDMWAYGGKPGEEAKIAAIGVRVRRWVTFHGVALNVDPDLSHFSGIVPCGIKDYGVTSLVKLGLPVSMHDVDVALQTAWKEVFAD